ncbi:MAG TPA: PKD domain-containing protein [Solirubrobacteraceae bacterium]|nr:PKD domain-containing protein [Solirubrobacteraceae bacterium]
MRRLLLLTAALIAIPAASAHAAAFPGDPVDGPGTGSEVQSLGDADLARDGTGALTYVKRVDGLDEIFVARFVAGVFAPGERIDAGLPGAGSHPVVGASDGGRLALAFVNDGIVYGVVRPAGQGYAAPVPLGIGSDPSVALSINGTAYASFTSGGDVRVARLDRRTNTWGLLDQVADVDPANVAGVGTGRSRVAISADGIGVVTWGENGHVYARKMFGMALSNAPQDLTPATFEDRVATVSDLPDIDAEDDSSYAWVVFRQTFADGSSRILARRQRGTEFDPPVAIDAGGAEPVRAPDIDLNGRGVGLATTSGAITGQPIAALLSRDVFDAGTGIFAPSAAGPAAAAAMSENNDGFVASVLGGPGEAPFVRVLTYDNLKPTKELDISRPELGPVVPEAGFDMAVDRASGAIVAWIQASPAGRQLVAALFDREPGTFAGFTSARCCQPALAKLSWSPSFGLWGAHAYQVRVDGQLVGATTNTEFQLTTPLAGPIHHWQVTAVDIRGQTRRMRTRLLRVDSIAPRISYGYKRKKRVVNVSVRARDLDGPGTLSSGIASVVISWGDATPGAGGTSRVKARHRYSKPGTYPLQITARDKAGNVTVTQRAVVVG